MLQEQNRLLQRLLFGLDATVIALAWITAYWVRFELLRPPEWLPLASYLWLLPWSLLASLMMFWMSGLYQEAQAQRLSKLLFSVLRASALALIAVAAALSFYRELSFSRLFLILFGVFVPLGMLSVRLVVYILRQRRSRGPSHRHRVVIVGAGKVGQRLERSFNNYPWISFDVVGFLDDEVTRHPRVLGKTSDLTHLLDAAEVEGHPIQYVYLALPLSAAERIQQITDECSTRLAHVCFVPDLLNMDLFNARVSDVDGLPVLHLLDETPLSMWRFGKRGIDLLFSALFLLVISPLMAIIALLVKASSPGPVFYRQERMGLNGKTFEMLKFRSMPVAAEQTSGPVWATKGEDRATPIGKFLRRTSLDELPQFINVLRGEMSIVGPRPERPVFIASFRSQVPGYMLRHKVKAGITGWAQVNGWRGDTSIERRIEYDLYYIQHWSLAFDIKIMLMTVWKGFVHDNAY